MSMLFGDKAKKIDNIAPVVSNFKVQTSALGKPIPLVFGTTRIPENLLWYGGFLATPHTVTTSSGGGGGGSGGGGNVETTTTTWTYSASLLFGLCEGTVTAVHTVWRGKI